ncbi:MAG: glycosyltransferase, partial [Anaerolineae bacterium]
VENNPLVIQEAFAAHVPVIASNQGGMAEFVTHEQNGLLFTPGDADSLAAALRRLLLEPDLLPRLRRQAPAVKTVQAELAELLHIYHELHSPG